MIALKAHGGKSFAVGAIRRRTAARFGDHAFVKYFIMLPDFGRAAVHLAWDKGRMGSARYGLRIPQPPSPPELVPAGSTSFCSV
ncbi:MAG TPA: hypothetical protein VFU97_15050 [Xanthobacteraceae bacterium]|nr:hypothetical protein [Xanthobacteraceae bacterium]